MTSGLIWLIEGEGKTNNAVLICVPFESDAEDQFRSESKQTGRKWIVRGDQVCEAA